MGKFISGLVAVGAVLSLTWCATAAPIAASKNNKLELGQTQTDIISAYGEAGTSQPSGAAQAAVVDTGSALRTIYTYSGDEATVVTNASLVTATVSQIVTNRTLQTITFTNVFADVTNIIVAVTGVVFQAQATAPIATNITLQTATTGPVATLTTNTIAGYTTTAQADAVVDLVNAIRSALVSIGWIAGE